MSVQPETNPSTSSPHASESESLEFERTYDPFGLHRAAAKATRTSSRSQIRAWLVSGLWTCVALLPLPLLIALPLISIFDYPNPPATIGAILMWAWAVGFVVQHLRLFDGLGNDQIRPTAKDSARRSSVLVVGAGPVGLAVVKECLEFGLEVVAFERQGAVGGVFRYTEEFDGGVWKSCRLTSSPWITAFSDFPPPDASSVHLSHTKYCEYLENYVDHFKLRPHLHFRHTVLRVSPDGADGWTVTVRNDETGEQTTRRVDRVAVCAGLNLQPREVSLPGAEDFEGEIRHVANYKGPEGCENKKVIVVGNGESGVDVAADVARVAEEAFLSIRRGKFIISRINSLSGLANDYDTNRIRYASPISMRNWYMMHKRRASFDSGEVDSHSAVAVQMLETSEAGPMSQTATKNDDFIDPVLKGRLKVRRHIVAFDKDAVLFSDGVRQKADVVIFAHGYHPSFPFLELPPGVGHRHPGLLYLRMFLPEVGDRLAFCGFARPAIGAIPPTGELQARLFALLAAGHRTLPNTAQMRAAVVEMVQENAATFPTQAQPNVVVSWIRYLDRVAGLVGCRPSPWLFLKDPILFWKVATGPMTGAVYRLSGPGANPVARSTIFGLTRTHPLKELVTLVGLHFWVWPVALLRTSPNWRSHNTFV
jgi:dimethylaniline monooxygenase (N-oxide forming)